MIHIAPLQLLDRPAFSAVSITESITNSSSPSFNDDELLIGHSANLSDLLDNPPTSGKRNSWMTQICGHLAVQHRDDRDAYESAAEEAYALILDTQGFDEAEARKVWNSIWNREQASAVASLVVIGRRIDTVASSERVQAIEGLKAIQETNDPRGSLRVTTVNQKSKPSTRIEWVTCWHAVRHGLEGVTKPGVKYFHRRSRSPKYLQLRTFRSRYSLELSPRRCSAPMANSTSNRAITQQAKRGTSPPKASTLIHHPKHRPTLISRKLST
jgi:hypothetical protein